MKPVCPRGEDTSLHCAKAYWQSTLTGCSLRQQRGDVEISLPLLKKDLDEKGFGGLRHGRDGASESRKGRGQGRRQLRGTDFLFARGIPQSIKPSFSPLGFLFGMEFPLFGRNRAYHSTGNQAWSVWYDWAKSQWELFFLKWLRFWKNECLISALLSPSFFLCLRPSFSSSLLSFPLIDM